MKRTKAAARNIFPAIEQYARAYRTLGDLHRQYRTLVPNGDQKTGVIAEFYARLFARIRYAGAKFEFGPTSQHAWDFKVTVPGRRRRFNIQVKAVSAHADWNRISPIHRGWNELWLMRLDRSFHPVGFWIVPAHSFDWKGKKKMLNRTMPKRSKAGSGSKAFKHATDHLDALRAAIRSFH
jgi:hypothetical protein